MCEGYGVGRMGRGNADGDTRRAHPYEEPACEVYKMEDF